MPIDDILKSSDMNKDGGSPFVAIERFKSQEIGIVRKPTSQHVSVLDIKVRILVEHPLLIFSGVCVLCMARCNLAKLRRWSEVPTILGFRSTQRINLCSTIRIIKKNR